MGVGVDSGSGGAMESSTEIVVGAVAGAGLSGFGVTAEMVTFVGGMMAGAGAGGGGAGIVSVA